MKKWIVGALVGLLVWNIILTYELFHKEETTVDGKTIIQTNIDAETNTVASVVNHAKTRVVSVVTSDLDVSGLVIEKTNTTVYIVSISEVANASEVDVIFDSGAKKKATVIGVDEETDMCVLSVETDFSVDTIDLDSQYDGVVGERVIALGARSLTSGNLSVSLGIRSDAANYQIRDSYYAACFQTDVNISRNQYGGAAISTSGEVEGMFVHTTIAESDGSAYVLTKEEMRHVYDEIRKDGKVTRGILDISVRPISTLASYEKNENGFDLDTTSGLFVTKVKEDSCCHGVLQYGDLILKIDDETMNTMEDLKDFLYKAESNEEVTITYVRDEEQYTETVVLK